MKRDIKHIGRVVALAALCMTGAHVASAQAYAITDLGTFGGKTSAAAGVNSSGYVVGSADTKSGGQLAFFGYGGALSKFGPVLNGLQALTPMSPATDSAGHGINDSGAIVGEGLIQRYTYYHALLWQNNTVTDLGTLGGDISIAWHINSAGQIVGLAQNIINQRRATLWTNGKAMDIGTLGGTEAFASHINTMGHICGGSYLPQNKHVHAFLWESAPLNKVMIQTMLDLGTLGGMESQANSMNDSDQVVGNSTDAMGDDHAFVWDSVHGMKDLGTLNGGYSAAYGINNVGQIVGSSDYTSVNARAFLSNGVGMIDLNTLLPPNSGWTLRDATGINDSGVIVGSGINKNGAMHAYQMFPILPTSVAVTPSSIKGGQIASGKVSINALAPVSLGIDLTIVINGVSTQKGVWILAGQSSALFTFPTAPVKFNTNGTVTATFNGGSAKAMFTVTP